MKTKVNVGIAGIFIAVALALTFSMYAHYGTVEHIQGVHIEDRERIVDSDRNSRYLVFTRDEAFENVDTLAHFKWNSTDVYRHMNRDSVCDIKVNGFRIPFLSMYRNVLEADCKFVGE